MKKILVGLGVFIIIFMIVQTVRFNYGGRDIKDFEFFYLNKKQVELAEIFDENDEKLILYMIPDCESGTIKIQSILDDKKYVNSQLIIISVGLKSRDFQKFYADNFAKSGTTFLIDVNNTFYRDFGLGFTEEFPTVIQYNVSSDTFERLN
jgi:hypothetical protein